MPRSQTGYDWTDFSNAPSITNYILIGDLHTHPTLREQGGYPWVDHEVDTQFSKGVPGIAVTDIGPLVYGPNRLGSNPERAKNVLNGYPGPESDTRGACP